MQFAVFANHLAKLEAESKRLGMTELLVELFGQLDADEVPQACYLMQGSLVPAYQSLEFQLSTKMVIKTLTAVQSSITPPTAIAGADLFGSVDTTQVEQELTGRYKKLGDVGSLTEQVLTDLEVADVGLSLLEVHAQLVQIAQLEGSGSQDQKVAALSQLLTQVSPLAGKFMVRIIIGKLRLGFSTMTMLDALSWVITGGKDDSKLLEQAYQKKADVGQLAQAYLQLPAGADLTARQQVLEQYQVTAGIPVVPALCQRLNTSQEIIEKLDTVIAEPKYDGLRIQLHMDLSKPADQQVAAFTRNLGTVTVMFPELQRATELLQAEQVILDGEVIGYDPESGELKPFQDTISRKRKHAVAEQAEKTPIKMFVYDLLYLDGVSLIDKKLQKRKDLLKSVFSNNEVFVHTPYIITKDPDELRRFHEEQLDENLEGAVVKQVDSIYQSGRKGWNWVKIKESEGSSGKLNDTLDLVVMGYYQGRGKRAEFEIGSLLMGVVDGEEIKTLCKLGSGLTEENSQQLLAQFQPLFVDQPPANYHVHKNLQPDVWVQPEIVIEVAADELTVSPTHTAGVALRFPRLITIREDKSWDQATSTQELTSISHLR